METYPEHFLLVLPSTLALALVLLSPSPSPAPEHDHFLLAEQMTC